jgi:hypothetical protein
MRTSRVLAYLTLLAGLLLLSPLLCPAVALAHQPQDWMLSAGKTGTFVNLDVIFGAFQAGLERRIPIYGKANQLTLRGSAIAAIPFGSAQLDADLRIVVLIFGASVGIADTWRNQTFTPQESLSRKERREREAAGEMNGMAYGFFEGRVSLVLPMNDYLLFNCANAYRLTSADSRSFDNLLGVVHDGDYLRSDIQLFFKHKAVGGFAPTAQILNFPLDGGRHTQVNYGFTFVSRAGLVRRDDVLLFQLLVHPGGTVGGYDNKNVYGMAVLRGPVGFTLAYRSVINL